MYENYEKIMNAEQHVCPVQFRPSEAHNLILLSGTETGPTDSRGMKSLPGLPLSIMKYDTANSYK